MENVEDFYNTLLDSGATKKPKTPKRSKRSVKKRYKPVENQRNLKKFVETSEDFYTDYTGEEEIDMRDLEKKYKQASKICKVNDKLEETDQAPVHIEKIHWRDRKRDGSWQHKYITVGAIYGLPSGLKNYTPTFTIAKEDHDGYLSLYKLFMKYYKDPTEMHFIDDVFDGDILHWEALKSSPKFKPHYENWKREAIYRFKAEMIQEVLSTALDPTNKQRFTALKYLNEVIEPKEAKRPVGRPSKTKADLKEEADSMVTEAWERMQKEV